MIKALKTDVPENVNHSITFISSDPKIAEVDENGNITVNSRGVVTIAITVTDEFGNKVSNTCKVDTRMNWWEWLIRNISDYWNSLKVSR